MVPESKFEGTIGDEIRIWAERRLGELIKAQKQTVGLNQGAVSGKTGLKRNPVLDSRPTLASQGIDKNMADRARKLAAVPDAKFEVYVRQQNPRLRATQGGGEVYRYSDHWGASVSSDLTLGRWRTTAANA